MKRAVIYIQGEIPQSFEVGKEYRYKKGTLVNDIVAVGGELRIYFQDRTYIYFNNVPYEFHGELSTDPELPY